VDLIPQTQPPLVQQKTPPSENRLQNKFNHPWEYSNYNLLQSQNVLNGLTHSNQELSERARLVSKSTLSLHPQDKKLKLSKPLLSHLSILDQHKVKMAAASKRGKPRPRKVAVQAEVHLDQTADLN
jgi:hypothetical protein